MTTPNPDPARTPDVLEAVDAVREPDEAEGRASEPGQRPHAEEPVFTDEGGMNAPG